MNILLIGNGGREHALAWKMTQSSRCEKLYVAPGNAGTALVAENVSIAVDDFKNLGRFCVDNNIRLVVVGPEVPLVKGIRNYFENDSTLSGIGIVGPDQTGAQLEGSKDFSKQFMLRHGIPTAKAKTFNAAQVEEGLTYIKTCQTPIVLKADGLAAGKGVVICPTHSEAGTLLQDMLTNKKFGDASTKVLIEEFLDGIELSVFVLTDGKHYVCFPEAKDYKRIGEKDTGPNTGGMGAVSPVPFANKDFRNKVDRQVIQPTIAGLAKEKIDFKGFIFIGLMNVGGNPFVIEYNVRLGDPETQVILPRIENDLVELFEATVNGNLDQYSVKTKNEVAATVVLVSGGYPEKYEKGKTISMNSSNDEMVFHAGTRMDNGRLLTDGGRVLAVTGIGDSIEGATKKAYKTISTISWDGLYFRKDIGKDLLNYTKI
ncbi:MAG: phosphoribosylamine--glycine ligase [Flammeovirgaceae bacterium]|nr:phosphoribosylamine--glycine ligase [Flammeovirgaceae bacterium]